MTEANTERLIEAFKRHQAYEDTCIEKIEEIVQKVKYVEKRSAIIQPYFNDGSIRVQDAILTLAERRDIKLHRSEVYWANRLAQGIPQLKFQIIGGAHPQYVGFFDPHKGMLKVEWISDDDQYTTMIEFTEYQKIKGNRLELTIAASIYCNNLHANVTTYSFVPEKTSELTQTTIHDRLQEFTQGLTGETRQPPARQLINNIIARSRTY
ncbi:MAG: hypothetical protein ACE5FT_01715 [Candidatus Nanoarchaeia archaeon]